MSIKQLKMLAKAKMLDGYENMFRQQLESIFIIPLPPRPALGPVPRLKKFTPRTAAKTDDNKDHDCFDTVEIIQEHLDSFLNEYQVDLEQPMKGSEFEFDYADRLQCNCHKIILNCGRSYKDCHQWLKNGKKNTKNLKNNSDGICF